MRAAAISYSDDAASPAPRDASRLPPPSAAAGDELALVTDRAAFDALEAEWTLLFRRAGRGTQVFQTFNWCWHWCNHYLETPAHGANARTLAIVTARRGGRLVMVCPLVAERTAGLRKLAWLGAPVSQYGDVLIEEGIDTLALLRKTWDFIRTALAPDIVLLRKVRDDAAIAPLLAELGATVTLRQEAPYLDLASADNFAAYEQRYSPRSRRNRRRLERRFAERGKKVFERYESGARARDLAKRAIALKRSWIKERGLVSPALSDPRMAAFFADVAEGKGRPVGCHISALTCDGDAAAIEITLRCKQRTLLHVIVFNMAYQKVAAGVLLLEHGIAHALENGDRTFDLLAPADGYKLDWADGVRGVCDWALPLSLKGSAVARLYLGLALPAIKRALAALPKPLRRFVAGRFTN